MGCGTCATGEGLPKGCKNNGSCQDGGCSNKLNVFDWLSNMQPPNGVDPFPWVEVRFKNTRKEFYYNPDTPLQTGDVVVVESNVGHDVGIVSAVGELVRLQMKRLRLSPEKIEKRKIYRKAKDTDVKRWKEAMAQEYRFMTHSRQIAIDLGLEMKISDVECQGDGSKATFYYTADGRVDFREMIKILARDLKIRIEMRQIGARQEAGRLGGIGVCGRELCCSTWLRDFRSVTTAAARYQQLSINPQKLAGQCGKLKCCLNYELDSYLDVLREFPKSNVKLKTKAGDVFLQKIDIFRKILYYSYENSPEIFIPVELDVVKEIIAANSAGNIPDELVPANSAKPEKNKSEFSNVIEEDSISRFDAQRKDNRKRKNFKKKKQADA